MTRIVALLSFWDEQPATLHRLIASLHIAGIQDLVALDGRYDLLDSDRDQSPPATINAIRDACATHGISLTLHQPDGPFAGNEIEKRTLLFALGETVTTPEDFYLIVDADEEIEKAPADLHDQLASTPFDVAQVTYHDSKPGHLANWWETIPDFPKFFRAIRGLHVTQCHYRYVTPDGRNLWGNARSHRLAPRHPIPEMAMIHHRDARTPDRDTARLTYYETRNAAGIETHHTMADVASWVPVGAEALRQA